MADVLKTARETLAEARSEGKDTAKSRQVLEKILSGSIENFDALMADQEVRSMLTTKEMEAVVKTAQNTGVEITAADEKRAIQTQRDFLTYAYITDKNSLEERKVNAEGFEKLNLGFKETILDTKNTLNQTLLNVQEKIASSADVSNLTGAMSQDMSLMTMELQGLMQLPGMKTIVAALKFVAATMATLFAPKLMKKWFGPKEDGEAGIVSKAGAKLKETGGKAVAGAKGLVAAGKKKFTDPAGADRTTPIGDLAKQHTLGIGPAFDKAMPKIKTEWADKMNKWSSSEGKGFTAAFKKSFNAGGKKMGTMGENWKKAINGVKDGFAKVGKAIWSATGGLIVSAFKYVKNLIVNTTAFKFISKTLKAAAKALWTAAATLVGAIMGAVGSFLLAAAPYIAIIVLVVLIAVGIFMLITMIRDKWETIKVKMAMAMDRLALVGTKIKNWFSDAAGNISYTIQLLIAKVKDGFVSMANNIIDKVNSWLPESWQLGKMEGGDAVEKTTSARAKELARREERDKKLEADFEAKYADRGKQLEDAAKTDADRKAERYGEKKTEVNTTAVVTTNEASSNLYTQGTGQTDFATLQAIQARG